MPAPRWDTQKSLGLIIDGFESVKNSLATSHCQIFPLKWVASSVMCLCRRSRSCALVMVPSLTPVVSQPGSWLCHIKVCPRTSWPCCWAKVTRRSAADQSYVPRRQHDRAAWLTGLGELGARRLSQNIAIELSSCLSRSPGDDQAGESPE